MPYLILQVNIFYWKSMRLKASKTIAILFSSILLVACNGNFLGSSIPKHERPVPQYLIKLMKAKGMSLGSPIMLRIYKEENVMEVWKQDHRKRYALLNSYEICKWSGKLGPKYIEGDRQAPEGFYHVNKGLMNPNSSYHLSFNLGYPNTYDRSHNRTGSYLMVHGDCSSAGCYSMTDEYIEEIYSLAREAFKGGQKAFQVQAFPFRMTAENMAKKINHPKFEFWKMLKEGSDHFEVTHKQPKVDVCEKRYVFNRIADDGEAFNSRAQCPAAKTSKSLALAFNEKQSKDQEIFDKILKRNSISPFVKPEDKPLTTNLSIKAEPTIGVVAILEPPKPEPVAVPTEGTAVSKPPEVDILNQPSTTQVYNPISAEIVKTQPITNSEAPQTQSSVESIPNIAVPVQAKRVEPQF